MGGTAIKVGEHCKKFVRRRKIVPPTLKSFPARLGNTLDVCPHARPFAPPGDKLWSHPYVSYEYSPVKKVKDDIGTLKFELVKVTRGATQDAAINVLACMPFPHTVVFKCGKIDLHNHLLCGRFESFCVLHNLRYKIM